MKTEIKIWSAIGHTPLTERDGSYCDELLNIVVETDSPEEAQELVERLIVETRHGARGFFHIPSHPNQNTRSRWL